jgi:hypothetical protein
MLGLVHLRSARLYNLVDSNDVRFSRIDRLFVCKCFIFAYFFSPDSRIS